MPQSITFPNPSGSRTFAGVLARPTGAGPNPAIVVVHEWWGINDQIKGLCERLASEGFIALAVDLYDGVATADGAEAAALSQRMKTSEAMDAIGAAVAVLTQAEGSNGKVGVTGFCLGGGMALAAAANVAGLSAAVPFYGTPRDEFCTWDRVHCPVLGHFAQRDGYISADRVNKIEADMKAAGVNVKFYWYNADHAFMRETDPGVYDPESAALAWRRSLDFLRAHLA